MTVDLQQTQFGTTSNGVAVDLYTFHHSSGLSLSVTNYGCIITNLITPDKNSGSADIVLGYDTLAEYEQDRRFQGCVVGRYANRIAHGRFCLDGIEYQLETNPSGHHLHGGSEGFNKQVWNASVEEASELPMLVLQHSSPHMQAGYPGKLDCRVTYKVAESGDVVIQYHAASDRPTVVNLTNHSYFNLAGHQHATENAILDHRALLNCDSFIPTDDKGIPVSGPVSVSGTPMDFRNETAFGERIEQKDVQLINGKGYDHNWVVNEAVSGLPLAARITDSVSGRVLEVLTTQPGIQCYTANNVDDLTGKGGAKYQYRGSVCLETQHFPDSPNQSSFPSTVVAPDNDLNETTIFRFPRAV